MIKNIVNWTLGGFFRTLGKFLLFLLLGLVLGYFVSKNNIKFPLIGIGKVSAATISPTSHRFSVFYGNLSCNASGTNCVADDDKSSGWTNYSAGYSTPSGYYGLSDVYLEVKTGSTMLQPGVTYTFNFDHWYNERNSSTYYSKNTYTLAGSDSGGWSGNSEAFIRNLVCTSGISEGTTQRVSYSCSFQTTKPLNYFYMGIHYLNPSGRNNSIYQFISFGANLGSFVYDNAQVDSINNQTTIINQQTDKIIEQQEHLNDTLTDENVDDSTSLFEDYLDNFNMSIEGPLTAILRIPIDLLDIILVDYNDVNAHPDLCATLKGQRFCLPSGDIVWKRTGCHENSPFGCPDRVSFKNFFQLLGGGAICYMLLRRVVKVSEKVLDPTKTEMDVMKL